MIIYKGGKQKSLKRKRKSLKRKRKSLKRKRKGKLIYKNLIIY